MKKLLLVLLLPILLCSEDFIFTDNTIGIEISPVRLVLQESDIHTFSGGFSYFLKKQNAELHFPIYVEQSKYISYNEQVVTFDTEYRKFIDKGFYFGGLLRAKNYKMLKRYNKLKLSSIGKLHLNIIIILKLLKKLK